MNAKRKQRGLIAILAVAVAGLGWACGDRADGAEDGSGALREGSPEHPDGEHAQQDGTAGDGAGDGVRGEAEQGDSASADEPAEHPDEGNADAPADMPDGEREQPADGDQPGDHPEQDQPADHPEQDQPADHPEQDQPGDAPCNRAAAIEHCVQERAGECEGAERPEACRAEIATHCEQEAPTCPDDPPAGDEPSDRCGEEAIAHCVEEHAGSCEHADHPDVCRAEIESGCEREHTCDGEQP
jgi:hypothetical protein